MYQYVVTPAPVGAGQVLQSIASELLVDKKPDAFERLPINLTFDEIRAMVRDVLG